MKLKVTHKESGADFGTYDVETREEALIESCKTSGFGYMLCKAMVEKDEFAELDVSEVPE